MEHDPNWYAQKLGGKAPAQPQAYQQPQYPVQQPQVPAQYPVQQQPPQPQIKVTAENFKQAMNYWQGGEATKTERQPCPKCGSNHYYSRSQGNLRGPAPAPMCFECGFNGMYEQGQAPS